ncbi:tRNA (adenosine(37)-N6)-threonylcarbamoyltransferase complex ATPase subunit type 1 TsaE [Rappaport israeli]|uniref:tRNA (adenosine(37)-N6)-threonylcarbamoyltransferase complex ATPase subunit type 1 TsaE n=1 Tax=Rappaport israeli TaxID=1839807 RepID=UPI00098FA2C4|nr:tRNA (adenosine(37)-N6)-threonylcarbamoyltransferase complex ATPase subunit type 1 TsaE [Rappaport israeli]
MLTILSFYFIFMKKIITTQKKNLNKLSAIIAQTLGSGVIFLYGDLGVGKTTFVQFFLQNLGYTDVVTSPSYGLLNVYQVRGKKILHADLYRLSEPEELLYLDVTEWQDMADVIFVEWSEKGAGFLPQPDLEIYLYLLDNGEREVVLSPRSEKCLALFKTIDFSGINENV